MKRLLTYLFLVIGLGLIFSESTFAKEKVYFCSKKTSYMTTYTLTPLPCNKLVVAGSTKWKKISAKKYITYIINTYGREDTVIQSLYDEFEKHDLDTNIIRKITKKEKKKKKTPKDKKKAGEERKKEGYGIFKIIDNKQEGIEAVIALCSNKKNLNKVTLSYFKNISEYKKNGSFKNGDCNYVVDRYVNPHLLVFLLDITNKDKYVAEKKDIDQHLDWAKEIFYVTPEGKFIEVVSLVLLNEPIQTQEVVEKSDKKKKKLTGKPFRKKKLVSFILNNVIIYAPATINRFYINREIIIIF